ncbi:ankyrin repeat-containing protein At5g02620-like [Rhododendron vialii]|uniref:ankyrin repeat-containing protein At5g02620-like n=1 Tax=Rhododendron vialii TaxID=182163 RepID=UPI00265FF391|nr:ankyrin repeat-containing protein At5g02620-like [Rhododendron vialii]
MSETEAVAERLYEACLSGSVETLKALIEKDPLILDRASPTECFSNDTPLHVTALRGHLEFTNALLSWKPTLAAELDSRRCTPLHLASTEGHFKIVHELLRVNPGVCMARDQDGRTPLHLAVMKGRAEVIQELLEAQPYSVYDKQLGTGESVLHLSINYNRLEALKTLVQYLQSKNMEFDLLNSKDNDGNTILHHAVALKQVDTIEYLLGIKNVKDRINDKNHNGCTALDIVERCPYSRDLKTKEIRDLLQGGVHKSGSESPCTQHCGKAGVIFMKCISWFWERFEVDPGWLKEARGHLITAATLTATMAYQSIMSPPGGFWQDTTDDSLAKSPSSEYSDPPSDGPHKAGIAILDTTTYGAYEIYLSLNTIVLGASLSTIMLAMTGFPMKNKFLTWLLVFTVYVKISCMVAAYVVAVGLVTSRQLPSAVLYGLVLGWMGLCAFVVVLHSCHFLVWLMKKLVKLVTACYGCCKSTPRATPKIELARINAREASASLSLLYFGILFEADGFVLVGLDDCCKLASGFGVVANLK